MGTPAPRQALPQAAQAETAIPQEGELNNAAQTLAQMRIQPPDAADRAYEAYRAEMNRPVPVERPPMGEPPTELPPPAGEAGPAEGPEQFGAAPPPIQAPPEAEEAGQNADAAEEDAQEAQQAADPAVQGDRAVRTIQQGAGLPFATPMAGIV